MEKQFLLHEHKTDENIIRWCYVRSSGFSRTILYPYNPDVKIELQDKSQVLEVGELPIYEMLGDFNDEYVYTLITTRYFSVVMGTTYNKYRIEEITLEKSINEVIDEYHNSDCHKNHITNFAKTSNGDQVKFITEVGTNRIMLYQILKDLNFMCDKYRKKHE